MAAAAASHMDGKDAEPKAPAVLLVEDDVLLRLWMADELRRAGFQVIEARHAREAMDLLNSPLDLDIVMTDIRMPGSMDGIGLARIVRERWPELKVLVASGEPVERSQGIAHAVLSKPLEPARVISRINDLLEDDQ